MDAHGNPGPVAAAYAERRRALEEATLGRPAQEWSVVGGREGVHTEHLGHMLSELQFLQRAYPGLEW